MDICLFFLDHDNLCNLHYLIKTELDLCMYNLQKKKKKYYIRMNRKIFMQIFYLLQLT